MSDNCIFCKVIKRELGTPIILENDTGIVIDDINPQAPKHFLIIPKLHVANILEALPQVNLNRLTELVGLVVEKESLDKGFRLVVNTGELGGQTVEHLHFHLLSGRHMQWPPG